MPAPPAPSPIPTSAEPVTEATERRAVEVALEILVHGREVSVEEVLGLVVHLDRQRHLRYARRVLARTLPRVERAHPKRAKLVQKLSLTTYKDPSLPAGERLREAWEILQTLEPAPAATTDQETLGLAGAIHKYRWMLEGQKVQLERALAFYQRGFEAGVENDLGYTAINAAFVLDLLADLEERALEGTGAGPESVQRRLVEERRADARAIRAHLIEKLGGKGEPAWWFAATLAEAHFGLGEYERAGLLLNEARLKEPPDWKLESTARQFAWLARLQQSAARAAQIEPRAWAALAVLWRTDGKAAEASALARSQQVALQSLLGGRIGLALSGGGFRASLFHIGVLARLAELDLLRHVEVLSCVSGGSIIGAYFNLALSGLLRRKPDHLIERADYVELVRALERDFLAGVQENLRIRLAEDGGKNEAQLSTPDYTRSVRLAELYDHFLFSNFPNEGQDDTGRAKAREARLAMRDLKVVPAGWPAGTAFRPRSENWRRAAKVPDLILNATTVNTGHNWQFTATWMGEPAAPIDRAIDANERFRRLYYEEAPPEQRDLPLSQAVAASSCVPALFEPLVLRGLYPAVEESPSGPGERVVRLVDGGVHDNQGLASLLEQECDIIMVSDASGEIPADRDPSTELWTIYPRINDLLMARVRTAQYGDLRERKRGGLLRGLMFLHLKRGLGWREVDWNGCADPVNPLAPSPGPEAPRATSYGVAQDVQRHLAGMRTDLDAFSDLEALALMVSGYRMACEAIDRTEALQPLIDPQRRTEPWRFLVLEPAVSGSDAAAHARLLQALKVSASLLGKWQKLSQKKRGFPPGLTRAVLNLVGAGVCLAALVAIYSTLTLHGLWRVLPALIVFWVLVLLLAAPLKLALIIVRAVLDRGPGKTISEVLLGLALTHGGERLAKRHLATAHQEFLAHGRVPEFWR